MSDGRAARMSLLLPSVVLLSLCTCAPLWPVCMASVPATTGSADCAASLPKLQPLKVPQPDGPRPNYSYAWGPGVLDAARAQLPEEVMVYRVLKQEVSRQLLEEVAALFGGPGPDGEWGYTVQVDGNGNYSMNVTSEWPTPPGSDEEAAAVPRLTREQVVAAAEEFLAHTPVLPEGCRLVTAGGSITEESAPPGAEVIRGVVIGYGVVYRRFLEGIPDGYFTVGINAYRRVYSVDRCMRDISPLGRYPIIGPDEARQALGSPGTSVSSGSGRVSPELVVIESVSLEYEEGGAASDLDTLQPVCRFQGRRHRDGEAILGLVPAVRPEFLQPVELPQPLGEGSGPDG